jgi:AAA15 family ATPase/GTPase
LHPLLVRNFLLTFLNSEINTNHAQLVFTTHDTWQLFNQLLRRDEIWFIEKDDRGVLILLDCYRYISYGVLFLYMTPSGFAGECKKQGHKCLGLLVKKLGWAPCSQV